MKTVSTLRAMHRHHLLSIAENLCNSATFPSWPGESTWPVSMVCTSYKWTVDALNFQVVRYRRHPAGAERGATVEVLEQS